MTYLHHNLQPIAARLVDGAQNTNFVMLGDSQSAPTSSPSWGSAVLRGWNVSRSGVTLYTVNAQTPDEGWQDFSIPASVDVDAALADGTIVPPGFAAYTRAYATNSNFVLIYQPWYRSFNSYAAGNPGLTSRVQLRIAMLGVVDPITAFDFAYRNDANTILTNVSLTGLPITPSGAQWQGIDLSTSGSNIGSTDEVRCFLTTSGSGYAEAGRSLAIGGTRLNFIDNTGLNYGAIAFGGATLYDHLPVTVNGSSTYSTAERLAKFNSLGWPDVIGINLGTNMETTEANSIGDVWKTRYIQLLDWLDSLYVGASRELPSYVLFVPWATDSTQSRRVSIENALKEISDSRSKCGVLNLFRIVQNKHGDYDNWVSTYLRDPIHMNFAGATEFGTISWQTIVAASIPSSIPVITPPTPPPVRDREILIEVQLIGDDAQLSPKVVRNDLSVRGRSLIQDLTGLSDYAWSDVVRINMIRKTVTIRGRASSETLFTVGKEEVLISSGQRRRIIRGVSGDPTVLLADLFTAINSSIGSGMRIFRLRHGPMEYHI